MWMTFFLYKLYSNKEKQSSQSHSRTDDIFASLLSTSSTHTCKKNEAINGEKFSVSIASCGDPQTWSLLCALVCNDRLIICKKSKTSGDTLLSIHTSVSRVKRGSATIPTFHGAPSTQCALSYSKLISQPGSHPVSMKRLRYRPRLEIFQREGTTSSPRRKEVATLNSKLFLQLFGPEIQLSDSPVLMVGCENGHVFYCGLNTVGGDGELTMDPLYSLEQPVVALCASFFPRNKTKSVLDDLLMEDEDVVRPKNVSGAPNTLILVGKRGKIALCYVGEQDYIKFVEFHSPSPIVSAILVPDRCIIYSTLCGMHRICLRQNCVEKLDDMSSSSSECRPLLIPEMSFKFPERMFPIVTNVILLEAESDDMTADEEAMETGASSNGASLFKFQVTVMSLTGSLGSLTIDEGNKMPSFPDEYSADQELQKHLKSIEVTSERASIVNERVETLNARLAELNVVLTLLCDMLMARDGETDTRALKSPPFHCKFSTSFEDTGVSKWKPVIDVDLSYNSPSGGKPLGKGWSLIIQTCNESTLSTELAGRVVTSKVTPLVGLVPNSSVRSRISVELQPDKPLLCSLYCILHFNATVLCAGIMDDTGSSKTTSVLLCLKIFDALDFVQPFVQVSKEIHFPLVQIFSSTQAEETKGHHNQQYTLELPVFVSSVEQDQTTASEDMNGVCGRILTSLLPFGVIAGGTKKESVSLTVYDGSSLTLAVVPRSSHASINAAGLDARTENHCLHVFIKSSSKTTLLEVASCVQRRLKSNPTVEESGVAVQRMSRDEKFSRLAKLNQIAREVNMIFSEIGKLDKERFHDSKSRQMKLAELESRTFKLLCQLQELL